MISSPLSGLLIDYASRGKGYTDFSDYGLQRVYGSIGGMISSPLSGLLIDYASRGKGYTDFRPAFYLYAVLKVASGALMLSIDLEFKQPAQNLLEDVISVFRNVEIVALFIACFIMGETDQLNLASTALMLSIDLEFKQPAQNLLEDVISVFRNVEIVALFIACFIMGETDQLNLASTALLLVPTWSSSSRLRTCSRMSSPAVACTDLEFKQPAQNLLEDVISVFRNVEIVALFIACFIMGETDQLNLASTALLLVPTWSSSSRLRTCSRMSSPAAACTDLEFKQPAQNLLEDVISVFRNVEIVALFIACFIMGETDQLNLASTALLLVSAWSSSSRLRTCSRMSSPAVACTDLEFKQPAQNLLEDVISVFRNVEIVALFIACFIMGETDQLSLASTALLLVPTWSSSSRLRTCSRMSSPAAACTDLEFKQPAQNLLEDVISVFRNVEIVALFIACFIMGTAWGYIESFLFWLLQDLGASRSLMGITITVGGIAGLPLLVLSGPIIRRLGHANVLFIGFVFYAIRLLGYSLIYNPWLCLIFEALESVTSSLSFTAAVTYAARLSSTTTDTSVQGLLGGLYYGVGKGAGSLIGGYLMKFFGTRPTYQIFSAATLLTGCIYYLFNALYLRKRPGKSTHDNDICKKKPELDVESRDPKENDKVSTPPLPIDGAVKPDDPAKETLDVPKDVPLKLTADNTDGSSDSGVDNPAFSETEIVNSEKKNDTKTSG
ncbi:MFS_1 like family domain-containing protein [Phthorimaea operculella]|nr:MFS_1 like family domain-containing protein [Phthorimaea operculella]